MAEDAGWEGAQADPVRLGPAWAPGESVDCEDCGEPISAAQAIPSPYEADDGGSYCPACAALEWAHDIELRERAEAESARERARAARLERALEVHRDATDATQGWRMAGGCKSSEPMARSRLRAAVSAAIAFDDAERAALAADAPGDAGEGAAE